MVGLHEGRILAIGKIERQDAWSQTDMKDKAAGQQAEWRSEPVI